MKKAYKRNSDYCMMSDAAVSSSSSNYEGKSHPKVAARPRIWSAFWSYGRYRECAYFLLNWNSSQFLNWSTICFKCATDDRNVRQVTSRGICFRLCRYFVGTARVRELFLHSFGSVMAIARCLLYSAMLIIFFWLFSPHSLLIREMNFSSMKFEIISTIKTVWCI